MGKITSFLLWVYLHLVMTYPTHINQISLTFVKVTAASHFQWKSMGFHLNRHIVLRSLGLVVPYQTCGHLKWLLQGICRIRSLRPHFWVLWVKVEFFHYNQWDRLKSINQWPFKVKTWYLYPRCIMTRLFIACYKIDLDFVFKVTRIIESFHIWNLWRWHKKSFLGLEDVYHDCRHI